jgi:hypothetical protein
MLKPEPYMLKWMLEVLKWLRGVRFPNEDPGRLGGEMQVVVEVTQRREVLLFTVGDEEVLGEGLVLWALSDVK